jgi:hypothetical protein
MASAATSAPTTSHGAGTQPISPLLTSTILADSDPQRPVEAPDNDDEPDNGDNGLGDSLGQEDKERDGDDGDDVGLQVYLRTPCANEVAEVAAADSIAFGSLSDII